MSINLTSPQITPHIISGDLANTGEVNKKTQRLHSYNKHFLCIISLRKLGWSESNLQKG